MHKHNIRIGGVKAKSEGYNNIICTTKSSTWGAIGPYVARRPNGEIMENSWQFRKIYLHVPKRCERYSRWNQTVVWDWPEEVHLDINRNITDAYWNWRNIGLVNPYPVRYPGGIRNRHNCVGFIDDSGVIHDYISSRQKYFEMYVESINTDIGKDSKSRTSSRRLADLRDVYAGCDILICEPDGPRLDYEHYQGIGVGLDEDGTILATEDTLTRLYNDPKYPFGHGYCLAWYLLTS